MKTTTALVTGASAGIGSAIAKELSQKGYFILVHYNSNEKKASSVLEQIVSTGGQGALIGFDVGNYEQTQKALTHFLKSNPDHQIKILVNNAGIVKDNFFALMPKEDFVDVVNINLLGAMNVTHSLIRHMMKLKGASIVNISSLAGQAGNLGQTNYASSKAGLIAFTKSLSQEVGRKGIRVNCVAPGLIETEMIQGVPDIDMLIKRTPIQRLGKPEDIAKAVSFLCSNDASFITGATLSVNGGLFPN